MSKPARYLTQEHGLRLRSPPTDGLPPGHQQFISQYIPSLTAGPRTITVTQQIHTTEHEQQSLPALITSQSFTVVAPRFNLPDGSVHSTYPPQGHGDTVVTLPHVVLTDPHLPWEREVLDPQVEATKEAPFKNRVPWLAVVVFTQDELRLTPEELEGVFKDLPPSTGAKWTQTPTLAVGMNITDVPKLADTTRPLADGEMTGEKGTAEVILVKRELFSALVTTHATGRGERPVQNKADVSRYRYLSHVRKVHTQGMADAGSKADLDQEALFSIVVSHRVGPLTITQPTPVVVHLVSVEGVEHMDFPINPANNSLNIHDTFVSLGHTLSVLSSPDATITPLRTSAPKIAQRLSDGYSLLRHLTQTGEETASLTRGPFTPVDVPRPVAPGLDCVSDFGTDLQIFDTQLGLMDITYTAAWQLGRTLALADRPFATALARVRTIAFDDAAGTARAELLKPSGVHRSRAEVLSGLRAAMETLGGLNGRHRTAGRPLPDTSTEALLAHPVFATHTGRAVSSIAGATDFAHYDEFNTANSADWAIVFKWILDAMNLVNIPAHYLITDPSHLPAESLRFFHIDANWVDALVDGGLSIANHLSHDDDPIRIEIKKAMNVYLTTPGQTPQPQTPVYGFLLRSALVTIFPDLQVEVSPTGDAKKAPILRHENIADGVMLCLFDRVPADTQLQWLKLTQPPHQQSFVAADHLDATTMERDFQTPSGVVPVSWKRNDKEHEPVFQWGTNEASAVEDIRTLLFPLWAEHVFAYASDEEKEEAKKYNNSLPGSAFVAKYLNNPMYELQITFKSHPDLLSLPSPSVRTLGMLNPRTSPPHPAPTPPRPSAPPSFSLPLPHHLPVAPVQIPHIRTRNVGTPPDPHAPASPPQFVYNLTSNRLGASPKQDLIFSIVLFSGSESNYQLSQLQLTIPLRPTPTEGGSEQPDRAYLLEHYNGTGPSMLSNLRFNVIMSREADELVLTLLPRSRNGWVKIEDITELSFVLSLTVVAENGGREGKGKEGEETVAVVDIEESYHLHSPAVSKKLEVHFPGDILPPAVA